MFFQPLLSSSTSALLFHTVSSFLYKADILHLINLITFPFMFTPACFIHSPKVKTLHLVSRSNIFWPHFAGQDFLLTFLLLSRSHPFSSWLLKFSLNSECSSSMSLYFSKSHTVFKVLVQCVNLTQKSPETQHTVIKSLLLTSRKESKFFIATS